jgi:hypothetical protein
LFWIANIILLPLRDTVITSLCVLMLYFAGKIWSIGPALPLSSNGISVVSLNISLTACHFAFTCCYPYLFALPISKRLHDFPPFVHDGAPAQLTVSG